MHAERDASTDPSEDLEGPHVPQGLPKALTEGEVESLLAAVHDTGAGIPADRLESVFERFAQVDNDRRGMGLGLYISKCIVEGHGGQIRAESVSGQGSTFVIQFPIVPGVG